MPRVLADSRRPLFGTRRQRPRRCRGPAGARPSARPAMADDARVDRAARGRCSRRIPTSLQARVNLITLYARTGNLAQAEAQYRARDRQRHAVGRCPPRVRSRAGRRRTSRSRRWPILALAAEANPLDAAVQNALGLVLREPAPVRPTQSRPIAARVGSPRRPAVSLQPRARPGQPRAHRRRARRAVTAGDARRCRERAIRLRHVGAARAQGRHRGGSSP